MPARELPQRLGDYEPLLELASGGMATVYVARQGGPAGIERLVALKRVHRHLIAQREFRDLFGDEARITANVRHPNVVPLIEVLELEEELLLVLEYVEGTALHSLLSSAEAKGALLPLAVTSRIVLDALAGLHAAHEARDVRGEPLGIIHRDVSPHNVLVGIDGASRIIDFGIAKAAARVAATASGVLRGKLGYMPPEQIKGQPLDRRADLFSAGVVLYQALTGKKPFTGDDEGGVLLSVLLAEVPPPSAVRPEVPEAVDEVVRIALERDRDARYGTAAEFQEALERALPPAAPREAAQLVALYRGDALKERRDALRAMLDRPPPPPPPPPPLAPPPAPEAPAASAPEIVAAADLWETTTRLLVRYPPARSRGLPVPGALAVLALGVVVLALGGGIFAAMRGPHSPAVRGAASAAPPAAPSSEVTTSIMDLSEPDAAAASPEPPPHPRVRPAVQPIQRRDLHRNPYGTR